MFNGKYSNFTYSADGSKIALNNEHFWGSSVLDNHREHYNHFKTLSNLTNETTNNIKESVDLSRDNVMINNKNIDLTNKLNSYETYIDKQSNAYQNHLKSAEHFCGCAIRNLQDNMKNIANDF